MPAPGQACSRRRSTDMTRVRQATPTKRMLGLGLELFFGIDQTLNKPFLHEDDHCHGRNHGQQGGRHDQIPFREAVAAGNHAFDADDDRVHVFVSGVDEGTQVLVPAVDELNDAKSGTTWVRPWHKYLPEETHGAGANTTWASENN